MSNGTQGRISVETAQKKDGKVFYLTYLYGTLPQIYRSSVDSFVDESIEEIYVKHLDTFKETKDKINNQISSNKNFKSLNNIDELFQAMYNNQFLSDRLEEGYNKSFNETKDLQNFITDAKKGNSNTVGILKELSEKLQAFMDALNTSKGVAKEAFQDYKKYYFDKYIQEAQKSYGDLESAKSKMTPFVSKILDSILQRDKKSEQWLSYDDATATAGEVKGIKNYDKHIAAILAAIEVILDKGEFKDSTKVFKDTRGDRKLARDGGKNYQKGSEYMNRFLEHISHIITQLGSFGLEYATKKGLSDTFFHMEKAQDELFKLLGTGAKAVMVGKKKLGTSRTQSGIFDFTVEPSMVFNRDKEESEEYQYFKSVLDSTPGPIHQRTSKADVEIYFNGGGDNVRFGISVKKYPGIKIGTNREIAEGSFNKTIKLQEGTPLSTAILREANASVATLNSLMALAGAHTLDFYGGMDEQTREKMKNYDDTSEGLNKKWESMKEVLAAKILLQSLAGVQEERVMLLNLNGRLYSIEQILRNLKNNYNEGYVHVFYNGVKSENFKRNDFVALNEWIPSDESSGISPSKVRAKKTYKAIANKMFQTKLKVELQAAAIASTLRQM